jgi:hypothetical protein
MLPVIFVHMSDSLQAMYLYFICSIQSNDWTTGVQLSIGVMENVSVNPYSDPPPPSAPTIVPQLPGHEADPFYCKDLQGLIESCVCFKPRSLE